MTTNSGGLLKRGMEASPSPRLEIRVASPMVYSPPAYSGKNVPSFPKIPPQIGSRTNAAMCVAGGGSDHSDMVQSL